MKPFTVVLTGNPNCGKTTLFNALTGLRGRVGNYAGVTVERKEGSLTGADARFPVTILDLPGTYSLSPQSPDEQIARDILFQRVADVAHPAGRKGATVNKNGADRARCRARRGSAWPCGR